MASGTRLAHRAKAWRQARQQQAEIRYPSITQGHRLAAQALAAHAPHVTRAVAFGYLALAVFAGVFAGGIGSGLGLLRVSGGARDALTLDHGVIMDCFAIIPALIGAFGAGFVPGRLGSPALAAPRAAIVGLVLTAAPFVALLVAPIRVVAAPALIVWCVGQVVQAAVLLATVLNMRAPAVTLRALSPFVWAQVATALVMMIAAPIMAAGLTRSLFGAADVAVVLHAFAFPLSVLVLLPACGLVSLVAGDTASGRRAAVVSVASGVMATGVLVWAHGALRGAAPPAHMLETVFLMVPSLCMAGCWAVALWRTGSASRLTLPWALAFIGMMVLGWVQHVAAPGTTHEVTALCATLAAFAGFYRWLEARAGDAVPAMIAHAQFGLAALAMGAMMVPGAVLVAALLGGASIALFAAVLCVTLARVRPVLRATALHPETQS